MRVNEPVTQREYEIADNSTLMSTTDSQSYVTYANEAFVAASGFTRDEITGQPHNFVRHPDMPSEAFADMWATLKNGEPWTALVKNRRKNGDHYWVRANAVPVVRDGRQAGYMSVRTKPSRAEVAAAEALYRDFRAGKTDGRRFHKGLLVGTGLRALLSLNQTLSVRGRIRGILTLVFGAMLAGTVLAGASSEALLHLAIAGGLGSILSAWFLEVQLARPLEMLRKQALAVATGESRNVAHMNRVDEIGMTMRTISQLGLMFRWLVDDVSQQVVTLQRAVSEIAQGNTDLSSRTEQAASSVQETASSMEQMAATVKQSADTAAQANQLSASASDAASRGSTAVAQVVTTMSAITASSNKIADIIGVIDSIAFQTNILALNAAVEAARAGEQGRGFAVVAGEVRNLARRCAEAAKEVKTLIAASANNVETGATLVNDAGKTMSDIVLQVDRVSALIGEISSATREQSTGITQVSHAVGHLDQITQQNAALVEQGSAASSSLEQQAARLVEAVSVFR